GSISSPDASSAAMPFAERSSDFADSRFARAFWKSSDAVNDDFTWPTATTDSHGKNLLPPAVSKRGQIKELEITMSSCLLALPAESKTNPVETSKRFGK